MTTAKKATAPAIIPTEATTKPAAKKGKPAEVANIDEARQAREAFKEIQEQTAAVMAELRAAQAEIATLRAQAASGGKKNGREAMRAAWLDSIPADKMADAATPLGKLERLDRNAVIQAGYKALGRVRMADLPALLEGIAAKAAEGGGMYGDATPESIVSDCLEVRERAKRTGKGSKK